MPKTEMPGQSGGCQHEYEEQYTLKHPGKVAECPSCEAKFMDGERMAVRLFAGKVIGHTKVKTVELFKTEKPEEATKMENGKIVKAVATVKALSDEEYALVLALCAREAPKKERAARKPRKTRGLPEVPAVAE